MDARRRVLVLAPFTPHRAARHGGGRVAGEFVHHLAKVHDVALVHVRRGDDQAPERRVWDRLALVRSVPGDEAPSSVPGRIRRAVTSWGRVLAGEPLQYQQVRAAGFDDVVRRVVADWRPDIIQAEYPAMTRHLPTAPEIPRVAVIYDAFRPTALQTLRSAGWRRPVLRLASRIAMRAREQAMAAEVDAIVVFSETDRIAALEYAGHTTVRCIHPGGWIPEEALDPAGADPPRLLFVGNFDHPPNRDAASWLVRDLFPAVRRSVPHSLLEIVGHGATRWLSPNPQRGIHVYSDVPDVTPHLDRAAVAIMPLRAGGGVRVKALEALAAGKAVVGTPTSFEGLSLVPDVHALVASTGRDLVADMVALLQSPERRRTLARNAREWAVSNLGWDGAIDSYAELYEQLLSERIR